MPAPLDPSVFDAIRELQRFCGENAAEKGFDENPAKVLEMAYQFEENGDVALGGYLRSLVHSQSLMLVSDEISEAHEEIRTGHDITYVYDGEKGKPEGAPTEIADAVIRLMHIAARSKIDLAGAMQRKLGYNASREPLHGRKF